MKKLKQISSIIAIFTFFLLLPVSLQLTAPEAKNTVNSTQRNYLAQKIAQQEISSQNSQHFSLQIQANVAYAEFGYFQCDIYDVGCGMLNLIKWIVIDVGNALVGISAKILDFFLHHSIQSTSYNSSPFIKQGWEILRDVTNIVFIFALITIAFQLVLGMGSAVKKRLMKVLLIALVINFSLFFSFAIIDASNIFAHVFYNKIEQRDVTFQGTNGAGGIGSTSGEHSLSLAIAAHINPQKLLTQFYQNNLGPKMLVVVVGGIINFVLIYTFISVALLFLGRTIGLWISSVLSPLAFASITIPGLAKQKYIGFEKWFSSLLQMAFMAPVFLFILYLAVQFMKIGMGTNFAEESIIDKILAIVIPMIAVIVLIYLAKKIAYDMAGDFAETISGFVTKIAQGAVAGGAIVASGGVMAGGALGSLASKGMGQVAKWRGDDEAVEKWRNRSRKFSSAKLDLTKIPGFGKVTGKYGKMAGSFTGRSLGGHIANLEKGFAKSRGSVFDLETEKIGKTKAQTAGINALRDYEKKKTVSDFEGDEKRAAAKYVAKERAMYALELKELRNEMKDLTGARDQAEDELMKGASSEAETKQLEVLYERDKIEKLKKEYADIEKNSSLSKKEKKDALKDKYTEIENSEAKEKQLMEERNSHIEGKEKLKQSIDQLSARVNELGKTILKKDRLPKAIGSEESETKSALKTGISALGPSAAIGLLSMAGMPFAGLTVAGIGLGIKKYQDYRRRRRLAKNRTRVLSDEKAGVETPEEKQARLIAEQMKKDKEE